MLCHMFILGRRHWPCPTSNRRVSKQDEDQSSEQQETVVIINSGLSAARGPDTCVC